MVSGQGLGRWYEEAKAAAIAADISPKEVDWLLQAFSPLDRLSLHLGTFKGRSHIELRCPLSHLDELWQQRLGDRIPLQYLLGVAPWRNFQLKVSPGVLIPRPETEEIIDLAVEAVGGERFSHFASGDWVDLGTGSGAIAIGLAEAFPHATLHAVDCSPQALDIARENAQSLNFDKRIEFYQGCWWEPLGHLKGKVCGTISNPPYIPTPLLSQLQPEVTRHEPHLALDGGTDGLDCIRHLVQTAPDYLCSGGIWLIEIMAGQGEAAVKLLEAHGSYDNPQIFPDLAGCDRFVLAYRSARELPKFSIG